MVQWLYICIVNKTKRKKTNKMTTSRAYAELKDNSKKGSVTVIRSYWKIFHRIELIWDDGIRKEYAISEFSNFHYTMA